MKEYLLMLSLLIGSSFAAKSQTTDTLCFEVPVIQKLLIDAKQKKHLDTLVTVYKGRLEIMQGSINLLNQKEQNYNLIIASHENRIAALNKEVSRWKRKNKWTAIGGIVLTGIVTTLFIIK
jgi:type II secretory pathway component PulF